MEYPIRRIEKELVVAGGGLPGIAAAVQAARLGVKTALVNNRSVLGGNSSCELDIAICGALGTAEFNYHSREAGIIEELLLENQNKNPQGNRYIWDAVLTDFVRREANLEVFLMTEIDQVDLNPEGAIEKISGTQQGAGVRLEFHAPLFVDDTGDGVIGYLAGAQFRIGREAKAEYGERIAPEEADEAVNSATLVFYGKDTGEPVPYQAPECALDTVKAGFWNHRTVPQSMFWRFNWYYELGGRRDQIGESQALLQEHRQMMYGIWDYVKNSGKFPAENYNLEYLAPILAKRESRRIEGDYRLTENDLLDRTQFPDVIGYGGWSVDHHAIDGMFSSEPVNRHICLEGIYQIPYRCLYAKDVPNLFLAGRCISVTHAAFGSVRVVMTLSVLGQAVGAAAALCRKYQALPREIYSAHAKELQQLLLKQGHFIPGVRNEDPEDLARQAVVTASSERIMEQRKGDLELPLEKAAALSLPNQGRLDTLFLKIKAKRDTVLKYRVAVPPKAGCYDPAVEWKRGEVKLKCSGQYDWIPFSVEYQGRPCALFFEMEPNQDCSLLTSPHSLCGTAFVYRDDYDHPVNSLEFRTLEMKKRMFHLLAEQVPCFRTEPVQALYPPENAVNGTARPYDLPNCWMAQPEDKKPWLRLTFQTPKRVRQIRLGFDANRNLLLDYQKKARFSAIPEIVRDLTVWADGRQVAQVKGNYQAFCTLSLEPVSVRELTIQVEAVNGAPQAAICEIRVYG